MWRSPGCESTGGSLLKGVRCDALAPNPYRKPDQRGQAGQHPAVPLASSLSLTELRQLRVFRSVQVQDQNGQLQTLRPRVSQLQKHLHFRRLQ